MYLWPWVVSSHIWHMYVFAVPVQQIFKMKYNSHFESISLMWKVGLLTTEHAFEDKGVSKLIERDDLKFDLVILEQFFHESWLLFAHKYKVPIVTIGLLANKSSAFSGDLVWFISTVNVHFSPTACRNTRPHRPHWPSNGLDYSAVVRPTHAAAVQRHNELLGALHKCSHHSLRHLPQTLLLYAGAAALSR